MRQPNAFFSFTSPLGPDALIPTAFGLEEALGQPFIGIVDLVSNRERIDPGALLHQPVCLSLRLPECPDREVHGLVRRFAATGPLGVPGMFGYRVEIVPALWFLSQTVDCRIFESKTTRQIVEAVLKDHKVAAAFRLGMASAPTRPFTMQYNESDLDFVSRLLQEEGWFYAFSDKQILDPGAGSIPAGSPIITDQTAALKQPDFGKLALRPGMDIHTLANFEPGGATSFGWIRRDDYDPERPGSIPSSRTSTNQTAAGAQARGSYCWPAHALKHGEVDQRVRIEMEAAEAEAGLAHGSGFNPNFTPGGRFAFGKDAGVETFVLHSVSHHATDETWRNAPNPPFYRNSFTAFPARLPWRPARSIRRPRMDGIYSALVLGPAGQEIHTDELGRVKVNFRWDHRIDTQVGSAVWVRVMQPWAGANAGWSFIPRVGTEVAVAFLDGDPDRPVVIGQFHNGSERPPWSLPDNKTRLGLRTRSTPGGGAQDCSEFWFDDKAGQEQVMLHAQRDLTIEAENDATHDIGQNRTITIREGNDTLTVRQGDRTVDVTEGDHTIKSSAGNIAIKTAAGAISIEAMQSLTLKVGQSSVTLDQAGVTIKGMMVKIEGQIMTSVKAPLMQLDADGLLKAAGGIMLLN